MPQMAANLAISEFGDATGDQLGGQTRCSLEFARYP